jgi:hypothetical protein
MAIITCGVLSIENLGDAQGDTLEKPLLFASANLEAELMVQYSFSLDAVPALLDLESFPFLHMHISPTSSLPNLSTTLSPPNPASIPLLPIDTFMAPNRSVLYNYFKAFKISLREEDYTQEPANAVPTASNFAYEKVANRVKPVTIALPKEYRIVWKLPCDPLADLPELPMHPPNFSPGKWYTAKWAEMQKVNPTGFLTSEEEKLHHWIFRAHDDGFAWCEEEKGRFTSDYFDLVWIPTIKHILWFHKNITIPPGIFDWVVSIIKDKIASGVYEESNSSYWSQWFCVLKNDGKALWLVHNLQLLNHVTIKDASILPILKTYPESFAGHGCYGMFDLFVGFNQCALVERSQDLTISKHHLVVVTFKDPSTSMIPYIWYLRLHPLSFIY